VVGLDPKDPLRISYKEKVGEEPTGKENPELLKLKHTHGHDMTIVNGVGRIGWMTGGKKARWVDEEMASTFVAKATAFIERDAKKPFFLYLATHDIHVPRVPHPRFRGTSSVGTRGDAIHELDDTVGQVLAELERLKLTENTLVIFTSDNGGVMDDGYEDVGSFDYQPNAPLRGTKGTLYEGGHRVPFIARWPERIKAGTTSNALIAHLDLMATFAALTDTVLPPGAAGDSYNVLPELMGYATLTAPRPAFVAHIGGTQGPFALRSGSWKFIEAGPAGAAKADRNKAPARDRFSATAQLFDLSQDLAEEHNLADSHPEKLKEMAQRLAQIRAAASRKQ
jgi:arylsulfatase A-like enzyme